MNGDETSFSTKTIHKIFKTIWKEEGTRASADSLKMSAELLRLFVIEAVERAAKVAIAEGSTTVDPVHLEKVVAQLLLDF